MSNDHSLRREREDHRNEAAARTRAIAEHENEVRRLVHDRWWRRCQPMMPSEEPVLVHDFDTECTL